MTRLPGTPRPRVNCARCGQNREHAGRGLCKACATTLRRNDTLEEYPPLIPRAPETPTIQWYAPPPEAPACKGANPWLFTDYEQTNGRHLVLQERGQHPRRLNAYFRDQVEGAFDFCIGCPLAVRDWCINDAVRPSTSSLTGVAGGVLWSNGNPVWTLEDDAMSRGGASGMLAVLREQRAS